MAVLTGMVAGGMVLSSFVTPKTSNKTMCSEICMSDGWRKVGTFTGKTEPEPGYKSRTEGFVIWEKDGMCNAYYWVARDWNYADKNPDETTQQTGALRKNSAGRWYAAYYGNIYYIDF